MNDTIWNPMNIQTIELICGTRLDAVNSYLSKTSLPFFKHGTSGSLLQANNNNNS